jgi:hypothetical protein
MKYLKFFALQTLLLILSITFYNPVAHTGNFTPKVLKISAPQSMLYDYYGSQLNIPVEISGAPAEITFLVYTNDIGWDKIKNIRNGNLGWHYVNRVDTCIYVSPPYQCEIGHNTITWNGRDKNGKVARTGTSTYYLWGYDNRSPKTLVTRQIDFRHGDNSFIQTMGVDKNPLPQPVVYDAPQYLTDSSVQTRKTRTKWIIGDDPDNTSLRETSSYMTWAENCPIAIDPKYPDSFYTLTLEPDGNLSLYSYKWVPNGEAVLRGDWGTDGRYFIGTTDSAPGQAYFGGPVCDSQNLIFVSDANPFGGKQSRILFINREDGSVVRKDNVSPRWSDPENGKFYGPSTLFYSNRMIFCGSRSSCITQMLDPYADFADVLRWENGNGDYFGDKNYDPSSTNPWKCNDPNTPPYPLMMSANDYHFSVFPTDGLGSASFGVYGPDGIGVGYFSLLGDSGTTHKGLHIVDYGSAYDGIYCDNPTAGADSSGWWYVGQDTFKGYLWDGGHDFEQPGITLYSLNDGAVYHTGEVETIIWRSHFSPLVRIEFSFDGGMTWCLIKDQVPGIDESYDWTIPDISSNRCLIKITDMNKENLTDISDQFFTVTGSTGVSLSNETHPENFITCSCYPNPFNPFTTIRYILPRNGKVTITLFNALGQRISLFNRGEEKKGAHEMELNGRELTSGVYFYRVETVFGTALGRMLLMK